MLLPVHIADVDQESTCSHKGHRHISEKAPIGAVHLRAAYGEVAQQLIGLLQFGYRYFEYSYLLLHSSMVTGLTLFLNK